MSWNKIYGHDANVAQLRTAFERGRLAHAYLFIGPSGVGKKMFANEFAKALLCEHPPSSLAACDRCPACKQFDVRSHPDFFSAGKEEDRMELVIETVREFADNLGMKAVRGNRKIGVLDDADFINVASANSLLKTLEEPPPGTILILLATTEESQLPTILSRCQKVRFSALNKADLLHVLKDLELGKEEHLERLAALGGGSVEQAMALDSEGVLAFRDALLKGLGDAKPDTVGMSARWLAFNEEVGKEAKLKRPRTVAVIRLILDFLRKAFSRSLGEDSHGGDAQRLAAHVGPDEIAGMMEACVEAERLIERRGQLELVIEQLMDRLTVR